MTEQSRGAPSTKPVEAGQRVLAEARDALFDARRVLLAEPRLSVICVMRPLIARPRRGRPRTGRWRA
jgi:hypothetical protein